jgi:hypothetical protein
MALVQRSGHLGISAAVLVILCGRVDVVVVEDFRVPAPVSIHYHATLARDSHHDLPSVNGQVCVVKRPIELLLCAWLIGGVVIWGEVWVSQRFRGLDTFPRVEDQHVLKQINRYV